jgi:F-type H+-transporting ATPase subunit gamma
MVKADRSAYKLFVVGDKGSVALSRIMPDLLEHSITHVQTPLNFPTGIAFVIIVASSIAHHVLQNIKDCDRILILYNEFKNVISQILKKAEVLNQ